MDEKNSYTREDVLEVLVKENRKFREEIMVILYKLIFGLCITTFIMVLGFVSVTYIYFYSPSDFNVQAVATNTNNNINENTNKIHRESESDK